MIDPRITEYSCLTHTLGTIGGTKEQWERWNWLYKEVVRPLLDGARGLPVDPRAGLGLWEAKLKRGAKRQAGAETGKKKADHAAPAMPDGGCNRLAPSRR